MSTRRRISPARRRWWATIVLQTHRCNLVLWRFRVPVSLRAGHTVEEDLRCVKRGEDLARPECGGEAGGKACVAVAAGHTDQVTVRKVEPARIFRMDVQRVRGAEDRIQPCDQ